MTLGAFNDTQNKKIVGNVLDVLKLNPITDAVPRQVVPTIQPVFEVTPSYAAIIRDGARSTTGTTTLFTTPSDRDFFLTYAQITQSTDVTADNTGCELDVTVDGTLRSVLQIVKQTTTATSGLTNRGTFAFPLKLDRGTGVVITHSFTVGASSIQASVQGFLGDIGVPSTPV